jgi:hypothetical protein
VGSYLTVRSGHFRVELAVIRRKTEWSPKVFPDVPERVNVHAVAGSRIICSVPEHYSYSTVPENYLQFVHPRCVLIVQVQYDKCIIQECSRNTALFVVNAYIGFTSEYTLE